MYIKNSLGLNNKQLLDILCNMMDFSSESILDLGNLSLENISSVPELYVSLMYLLLKRLFDNDLLIMDYCSTKIENLNYLVGDFDIFESINNGSLSMGYLTQEVTELSYDTPINNAIGYCFELYAYNKDFDMYKLSALYKSIFCRLPNERKSIDFDELVYNLGVVDSYLSGSFSYGYEDYRELLSICKLLLESLYYSLVGEDSVYGISDDRLIEYIMEVFTRVIVRRVMKRVAKSERLIGMYRIQDSDLFMRNDSIIPDMKMDILIRFIKQDKCRDIMFEVKTNEYLFNGRKYKHTENIDQVYHYSGEYKNRYSRKLHSILFHYISSEKAGNNGVDLRSYVISDDITLSAYIIDDNFSVEDVEKFISDCIMRYLYL